MSDNDTQDTNTSDETIEFSGSHFGEEAIDETPSDSPAEPTADTVETPAEEPTETEEPEPQTPDEPEPDEPDAEKTESELKGMSKSERREYFQNLHQEVQPEVEQAVNKVYQPQDVNALQQYYIEQGADEFQALQLARQDVSDQRTQIAEATSQIAELNANIRVDAVEARAKYEWMNPDSPNFDKDTTQVLADLFEGYTVKDPDTGQIIDVRRTPMQLASYLDKIRNSGTAKAQQAAQKAAEAQMAAVAPPTSTAPPSNESPEDKQAAGLERAFNSI